jgi:MFS family permease
MAQIYVSPNTATSTPDDGARPAMLPPGLFVPFFLVTALFFLWAIPNNMNDVLIPQFMKSFELSRFQAVLVQSAFYMGYFLLAMPAAILMKRAGYKAWHRHRPAALQHRNSALLAGGGRAELSVLSGALFRDRQRPGLP